MPWWLTTRKRTIKEKSADGRICLYLKPQSRKLLKLLIDAGFYETPSQFFDKMINDKALACLQCVKEEQIKAAELQVLRLRQVATEYDKIEQEAIEKKQKLAVIWNEIVLAFKKIYKEPGRYASARDIAQIRIQSANWLESRYLDDPETRRALFDMWGTSDKNKIFELVVQAIRENPNFEQ